MNYKRRDSYYQWYLSNFKPIPHDWVLIKLISGIKLKKNYDNRNMCVRERERKRERGREREEEGEDEREREREEERERESARER